VLVLGGIGGRGAMSRRLLARKSEHPAEGL
jgi:hypothetical protein